VYCDKIIDACGLSGTDPVYGQFANRDQCLRTAKFYHRSTTVNIQSGNTLDCRLYHAGVAGNAAFKDGHCEHSGANGKAVCGTACEGYCQLIMGGCTGTNAQFANVAQCLNWCATYPTVGAERPYATGNDTYQCHIYHAQVAVQRGDIADVHCTHAGPTGANVCGTSHQCRAFCRGQIAACGLTGTTNGQYASQAACETSCATWTVGSFGASTTSGNTLACRAYHATVAIESSTNAGNHCSHTSATGGGVCVSAATSSTGTTSASTGTGSVTPTTSSGINGATGVTASIGLVAALLVAVVAL
jgi:hypothetical protein